MSVLSSLAKRHTTLTEREVQHLHYLVSDWQLLADLSFADLITVTNARTAAIAR